MERRKNIKDDDFIKGFDATGSPFVITFGDLKELLKPEKRKVEKKEVKPEVVKKDK